MLSIQTNPKTIINRTTTNRVIESIIIIVEWKNKMVNKHVLAIKSNYYITAETIKKSRKEFFDNNYNQKKTKMKIGIIKITERKKNDHHYYLSIIVNIQESTRTKKDEDKHYLSLLNDNQIKLDQIYKTKNSWSLIIQLTTISL